HQPDAGKEVDDRVGLKLGDRAGAGFLKGRVDDAAILHIGRQEAQRLFRRVAPGHALLPRKYMIFWDKQAIFLAVEGRLEHAFALGRQTMIALAALDDRHAELLLKLPKPP